MQERLKIILGTTGTGKTTLMKKLMAQGPPRQILLDTMQDPAFQNWGVPVQSFEEMQEWSYRTDSWRIRWSRPPRSGLTLDAAAWLAMDRGQELGDVLLAVDEIQFFLKKQWNAIPQSFQDACLVGRHSNVQLLATSQRPSLVHNDFLSQAHRWYVFKTVLRDDLDSIRHLIPDVREEATDLEVGKYLTFP